MDKSEHETILSVCFKQSDWLLNNGQPIRDLKKICPKIALLNQFLN